MHRCKKVLLPQDPNSAPNTTPTNHAPDAFPTTRTPQKEEHKPPY